MLAAQTGVWLGQEMDPDASLYLWGNYLEIHGAVDVGALVRAITLAVAEAEALHVRFARSADGPVQVLHPPAPVAPRVIDLDTGQDAIVAVDAYARADLARPVDLTTDTPFAHVVFTAGPNRVFWYQRYHHIAVDAYGASLITRRVAALYTALVSGRTPPPTPFGSLAALVDEEAAYHSSGTRAADRAFWHERFADRPERISLNPVDTSISSTFVRSRHELPADTVDELLAAERRTGVRWSRLLIATTAVYLHRMAGADDIVLGLPVAGRSAPHAGRTPAMTTNVVPLRLTVRPTTTVADLVGQVDGELRAALAHQRYRGEDLHRELRLGGPERRFFGPMVNVMRFEELRFGEHRTIMHNPAAPLLEDLSVVAYDRAGAGPRVDLNGHPALYTPSDLDGHATRLLALLAAAARRIDRPVGGLSMGVGTGAGVAPATASATADTTLVDLVRRQVVASPGAPAVIDGSRTLSYGDLESDSTRLATLLHRHGVRPEQRVALVLPRSAELVTAMLAVTRLGAAYAPIDPDHPADRVAYLLADTTPAAVVTTSALRHLLPPLDIAVLTVDGGDDTGVPETAEPMAGPTPDSAAYVIHTSGSTGAPKGVVVTHRNVERLLANTLVDLDVGPADVWTMFHSHAFDFSVWEIWGALTTGGSVVIVPRDVARAPDAFRRLLARERVTVLSQTPSAFAALDRADVTAPDDLSLRYIVFGGERLAPDRLGGWFDRHGADRPRLINMYGITETTVHVTRYDVTADDVGRPVSPIGTPLPHLAAYILDGSMHPVPAGAAGELYVAGDGVARGYLGRLGLTATRFVADPFGPPGARMYRTGDRVRWTGQALEFLGRTDDQVKVRGFRVEPGEIAAVLARGVHVAEAVVVPRENDGGEISLVAYVVPAPDTTLDPAALRHDLARTLPDHLVPAALVIVDALPLTANGKLDRAALPSPASPGVSAGVHHEPYAQILAELFADALGVRAVGAEDNFFDLGGHSLLATRLIGRIRSTLATDLEMADFFARPTVTGVLAHVAPGRAARPALRPAGRPDLVPLSPAQRRLWFLDRLGSRDTYHVPLAVRLRGPLDRDVLRAALNDLVTRHESLRTVYPEVDGDPYQAVLDAGGLDIALDERPVPADELGPALRRAVAAPFDLTRDLPVRCHLYAVDDSTTVLLIVLHHIAADGASMGPLVRDLGTAYRARLAGTTPAWPPLPVQYADYTLWQEEYLGPPDEPDSRLARQTGYWRSVLAGLPEIVSVPLARPRPAAASFRGDTYRFTFDADLHAGIVRLARETGTTVYMVLLAGLGGLLSRLGAGVDVPIGSPVAGRLDERLDDLVGFFVNTLVMRVDTSGDPTFAELLRRVRHTTLDAYAHQDVPFDHLVEVLNPTRSLAAHPLVQILLAIEDDIVETAFDLPGLDADVLPVGRDSARLDLSVIVRQHRGPDGRPSGMDGVVEFSLDLFDRAVVTELVDRWLRVLTGLAAGGVEARLSQWDVVSAAERADLLRWGDGGDSQPVLSLAQMVAQQVTTRPDAPAVTAGDLTLSYHQLWQRAGALSTRLTTAGVGPETVVGLLLPRGIDLVTAALAVSRACGVFTPLDPTLPTPRLHTMTTQADVHIAVTDHTTTQLATTLNLTAIPADDIPTEPTEPVDVVAPTTPHASAYIIFTSGSTGQPKGVRVPHTGLTSLAHTLHTRLTLGPDARVLQLSTPSFDAWVMELLMSLPHGATLIIAPPGIVAGHDLSDLLHHARITHTLIPPTLLATVTPTPLPHLRCLLVGAEACPGDLVHHWSPNRLMINAYGPTETTIAATLSDPLTGNTTPPIGRPVTATHLYVLDHHLNPVAPGVAGELYIAGAGTAHGYTNQPALTATRFIPDPHSTTGARMYRTGDITRWRPDGQLEYLGRTDNQIKIRGYRIELGEIETILSTQENIRTAAVTTTPDDQLIAYLVPQPHTTINPHTIKTTLTQHLPDYMIPHHIITLDQLPTTPNGKLNHAALPPPQTTTTHTPPTTRTPHEEILCGLMADILKQPTLTPTDNFFDHGGHSLLATRLISRIRSTLGGDVPIRTLFESPTPAALATRLAATPAERPRLRHRPDDDPAALSAGQQRLLLLDRIDGPSPTYTIGLRLTFDGDLDVPALAAALGDVVGRHEPLRTVYPDRDGQPAQRLLPADTPVDLSVITVDVADLPTALLEAARVPFDLATDLPLRAVLFRLGPSEHVLLLLMHHIAADGWSLAPLSRDLVTAYAARRTGEAPRWEPLPVRYADYVGWQRELLGGVGDPASRLTAQTRFWQDTLAGLPERIALPADRPDPATATHRGAMLDLVLDADLHAGILATARAGGATVFMVLLAGLAATLARLGTGTDVPIGTPVAGRTDEKLDDLVGFFVNTLVMRVDLTGNPTFADLVTRVRDVALDAYAHDDVPFEHLVEVLNPARSLAHHPLFQVMLALQNTPDAAFDLADLHVELRPVTTGTARFDLFFSLLERYDAGRADGLRGIVEYATDRFDAATVEALVDRWRRLLAQVVADPGRRLNDIDVLTADERGELDRWGTDAASSATATPIADQIAAQAAATPENVAVEAPDGSLTYAELLRRADDLAATLAHHGVAAESIVAVALPRCLDLYVALVAVLRAGAAYLPIDLGHPAERIGFMLADTHPALLLTTDTELARHGTPVLGPESWSSGHTLARPVVRPDNPAYVVYTSGSTGAPKAVVMPSGALANLLAWQREELPGGPGTRTVQFTSVGFDVAAQEIFGALTTGRTLLVPDDDTRRSGELLAGWLQDSAATELFAPQPVLAEIAEAAAEGDRRLLDLHVIAQAGEALVVGEQLRRFFATRPHIGLHNHYGPAETHVVTGTPLTGPAGGWPVRAPIGQPVAGARLLVLDSWLNPVPVGVAGDLYIGGPGLARGYLGRPDLTAERFVAGPNGSRLYRSGDRARWRPDGQLEFLGRTDDQVKIRGFRVEPGEAAAVLARHPGLVRATVIARTDQPAVVRLVGYAVPAPGWTGTPGELVDWLRDRLPDYLVPTTVVLLDALPVTPNGKLDRAALPAPVHTPGRAARNPREQMIADLFAEALGVDAVGVDDNFFDLGGHSLLATRLISRIRTTMSADVQIRALFETPTVAGLAARLDPGRALRPPVRPATSRPELLPLSSAQRRLWFLHRLEGPSPTYNMLISFRLTGTLDTAALRQALHDVVARHEALRTVYPEVDGQPWQRIVPTEQARVEFDEADVTPEQMQELLAAAARFAFDLATDLPLRASLLRLGPDEHVLLLVLHHVAGDGWSMAPLSRDIVTAYAARHDGRPPHWTPLPVQYADYTLWQEELLGAKDDPHSLFGSQTAYWLTALTGLPDQINIPAVRTRPAAASYRGDLLKLRIPADVHAGIVRLARETGTTVYMVLLAGLGGLLSRLGAGVDIPIGSPVAGRLDERLDDLVGFFVNTLVMRVDASGDPTFAELLHRVRGTALTAYAHQDVPFEHLVEELNPTRTLAHHPLFQIMLALQNTPDPHFALPGLDLQVQPVSTGTSRFDLALSLWERHDGATPSGMDGVVEFSLDLFDRAVVTDLIDRWLRILTDMATGSADTRLSQWDVVSAAERADLLRWGDGGDSQPVLSLAQMVAQQVTAQPDAPAVTAGDQTLTYHQLWQRAGALSTRLTTAGVRPETVVGLLLPRGIDLATAALAVSQTGGVFTPLDPTLPTPRLHTMTTQADVHIAVTDHTTTQLATTLNLTAIPADDIPTEPTEPVNVVAPTTPHASAYIIFTSGSTGQPKGVRVPHTGLTSLAHTLHTRLTLGPDARVLQLSTPSFDAWVMELLMSLPHGATLIIAPPGIVAGHDLSDLLHHARITHTLIPPTLLATVTPTPLPHLRCLLVGAEACPGDLVHHWSPNRLMINAYGPTETTIAATLSDPLTGNTTPPIGRPVTATHLYVLDHHLNPVAPGVAGELYIAGAGTAHGYTNQPALTATRFIPDPHSTTGARMYRTGDITRWRPDGQLEYLGRTDNQIKIRGYRIELGEIETILSTQENIRTAAVTTTPDDQLIAYLVPQPHTTINPHTIKTTLTQHLPDYMIPHHIITLDQLPTTPNGKLNHAALPPPQTTTTHTPPTTRTPHEEILCGLMADILKQPTLTPTDNFFDHGGHSLLATRLISRIRSTLGVHLDVFTLFEAPTAKLLAEHLRNDDDGRAPIEARDHAHGAPLSFAQRRLWFLHRFEGEATYNVPLALRLSGRLDVRALTAALNDVVGRHESLRTVFPERDGEPWQEIRPAAEVHVPIAVETVTAETLPDALARAAQTRFDLERDLPLRATLFRIGPSEHVLLLLMHHIAADGWSLAPLSRDLSSAYAARLTGEAPQWEPLPVQYADYTVWQHETLGAGTDPASRLARETDHWRTTLTGLPDALALPTDRPRPTVASYQGETYRFTMDAVLHERVVTMARARGATAFMVLLAGLAGLLSRLGAGTDVPVGSPIAGRTDEKLDDLVGFFVNTLVMRMDVSGDPTFGELVERARSTALTAYAHQDVPFEHLVEAVSPARSLAHHPLFQVMLALQNTPEGRLDMPGITASYQPAHTGTSRFDLFFSLWESYDDGRPAGLAGVLEYPTDLFDPATVRTLIERWSQFLTTATQEPDRPVGRIDVTTPEELRRVLAEWSSGA
ncbi:hypothetical protein TPA0908_34100 [Micromonospora sp. AKA38]|nr:hypothetical protein TPA0908_34100 [Micromonospora sp. AKA38]